MLPSDLGFPAKFNVFRSAQLEAIEFALTSEKRFTGIGAPPGVGKSGVAFALAKLLGGRTVILTANLGLESQYMDELGSAGLVGIRGRGNYSCWEGSSCEDGGRLGCKERDGCPYLGAFRRQHVSDIVVTNYAYWIAVNGSRGGFRQPDTLICDECSLAADWLSRALDFTITEKECREAGYKLDTKSGEGVEYWSKQGPAIAAAALAAYERLKSKLSFVPNSRREQVSREIRRAEAFLEQSSKLEGLDSNWVCTKDREDGGGARQVGSDNGHTWTFECIWPGRYREKLFRHIPRVILLSATLRPKTLSLLGIPKSDVDFQEWGRQFPAANGPVIWIPTCRVGYKMSLDDEKIWLDRNSQILAWGNDRNGLAHTVSYQRARRISEVLGSTHRIMLNGVADPESRSAREAYERFVKAEPGTTLVSPSFSTGWDFAGRAAEYQIITKIAFPPMQSKVMKARQEADKGYGNYLAAQDLVQGCGRIVRSEVDRGTTLVIDDQWSWFGNASSDYVPKWFKVRKEVELPRPLDKLT